MALSLSPLEETMAFASALAAARATHEDDEPGNRAAPPFRASIAPPPSSVVNVEDIEAAWRERRERAGAASVTSAT